MAQSSYPAVPSCNSQLNKLFIEPHSIEGSAKHEDLNPSLAPHAQIRTKKADYLLAASMPLESQELEPLSSKCTCLEAIIQTILPKSFLNTRKVKDTILHGAAWNSATAIAMHNSQHQFYMSRDRNKLNHFLLHIVHDTGLKS